MSRSLFAAMAALMLVIAPVLPEQATGRVPALHQTTHWTGESWDEFAIKSD